MMADKNDWNDINDCVKSSELRYIGENRNILALNVSLNEL